MTDKQFRFARTSQCYCLGQRENACSKANCTHFNQFGLHAAHAVKTINAQYYKAGGDRLLTIVLVRDLEGKRPDQMFYCTKLEWNARQILSPYSCR